MAEFYLGLDFGTSGARACVLGQAGEIIHTSRASYADPVNPQHWRAALFDLLGAIPAEIRQHLSALAIDATSGTLLATDARLEPVSPALMYNDSRAEEEAALIGNAQFGATSGLAKRIWLARHFPDAAYCFHQADWLTALLTGKPGITDYHNALKSGYDVENLVWPDWVRRLPGGGWQQTVLAPGEDIAPVSSAISGKFGINPLCLLRAGTTDSIAAFIAAGASRVGEAVTSLGTTLVLKLLSAKKVDDPTSGVYSHRFGKMWLAGGASNSGGGVLRQFFSSEQLASLSARIDSTSPSGLDYYPLPKPGERFPVNAPGLMPRMTPRPQNDTHFLHGLLEGMAKIEAMGYARLKQLGTTPPCLVYSAGGGAHNPVWQQIRQRYLGVPLKVTLYSEAAYGSARIARDGLEYAD